MKITNTSTFFHDKPLFGMDIGHGSLKVMQIAESDGGKPRLIGYGTTTFDQTAQKDGVVLQPEIIAQAAKELFEKHLIGSITTRRVAIAIPAYRTFTRSLQLPALKSTEIKAAVELEAEQYISVPLEELYLDYEITRQTPENTELFVAAVPQAVVDSYLELAQVMGLEAVLIEPTLSASSRLFSLDTQSDIASFIIDFGSRSSDISVFDGHVMATGTVEGGGGNFTNSIKKKLGVSLEEASIIKSRDGLGVSKNQAKITQALAPTLQQIVKEIRRMIRYYEERYGSDRPIGQIITLGGGANMPGLSEHLIQALRMPVRSSDPWQYIDHHGLQPPASADKPMYAAVAGLSLVNSQEIFST